MNDRVDKDDVDEVDVEDGGESIQVREYDCAHVLRELSYEEDGTV